VSLFLTVSHQNLEHFPDLKSLWLENNLLTTLLPSSTSTGLTTLVNLRCLYLQNNRLKSLAGLEQCRSLVLINVSSNALTNLEGLSELTHLQIIDAHDNEISDISALESMAIKCRALHTIDVSQNKIEAELPEESKEDADSEKPDNSQPLPRIFSLLSAFPALKVVYLKGNPLVETTTQYRRLLSSVCKRLSFLDDRPVSELDRLCAAAWKEGGREKEKEVRNVVQEDRRAKETER
jgi:dynein assembly factor 1